MNVTNQNQPTLPSVPAIRDEVALSPEIQLRLLENATRAGTSVEQYLHGLLGDGLASNVQGNDEDDDTQRPWRGLLVFPRRREICFSKFFDSAGLPRRHTNLSMTWHREADDDE